MPKEPDGGFTIDDSEILPPTKKEIEEEQKKSRTTKKAPASGNFKASFQPVFKLRRLVHHLLGQFYPRNR